MEIITRNEKILYIGIDVHKDTYSLCCFDFFRNELSDEMTIKATTKAVIKYLEAIKKKHREEILFACGYEAGPTGYGLCRGLQKAGYGCFVMAPGYENLQDEFMSFAKGQGMVGIKGHRSVGGFRASIYNACPEEDVRALVACMQEFESMKK